METIVLGYIAHEDGIPRLVYDQNKVVPFIEESLIKATKKNGFPVKAVIESYFPNGKQYAKILSFELEKTVEQPKKDFIKIEEAFQLAATFHNNQLEIIPKTFGELWKETVNNLNI